MKKGFFISLLIAFSVVFAKTPQPICVGSTGNDFPQGDGSQINPYLICTSGQFLRLGTETSLLNQHFILGADIDFDNDQYVPVGTPSNPFQGSFDGNNYTLSSIRLMPIPTQNSGVGVFSSISNATIENLRVVNVILDEKAQQNVGGLVGQAESSILINDHVSKLNLRSPRRSGGLVGDLTGSTIIQCSASGIMRQIPGADASGGLVGRALGSKISISYANVNHRMNASLAEGIDGLGGLVGRAVFSTIKDVFATGDINYNNTSDVNKPQSIGGIVGSFETSLLTNAYYAGKINISSNFKGGAIGAAGLPGLIQNVFWDTTLSGLNISDGGEGQDTATMKSASFWQSKELDQRLWQIIEGQYPKLFTINA